MRKFTAIFLFALFLYSSIGYRILFFYAQQQSDRELVLSLDKDHYNESELVTINVPLSLPYQADQADFQRVDGEITVHGKIYKYVKRKIADGNLILLCLPDYNKMRLKKEKDDFYKDANSLGQNTGTKKQENSKGNSFKNIISDFNNCNPASLAVILVQHPSLSFSRPESRLSAMPHSTPEEPPESV